MQGVIDGTPLPDGLPPLTVWVTPPVLDDADNPVGHVWGSRVRGSRQTAPRIAGMKKLPWNVDAYLAFMDTPDDALANESFPKVIDAVLWRVFTTTMPLFIDAEGNPMGSNQVNPTDTQVQSIGETFDLDYPPERLPASMKMVWYSARIGLDVLEVVQV